MLHIARDSIAIEKPFTISVRLTVSAPQRFSGGDDKSRRFRIISLAVQHIRAYRAIASAAAPPVSISEALNPRIPSGYASPSSIGTQWRDDDVAHDKLATASRTHHGNEDTSSHPGDVVLPPPFAEQATELKSGASPGVLLIGSSAVFLPSIRLSAPEQSEGKVDGDVTTTSEAVQDFELSFLPLRTGLVTMGGLRVLLVEDKMVDERKPQPETHESNDERTNTRKEVQTLREWEVVGEIWVKT